MDFSDNDEVFVRAVASGCEPVWARSMFGSMAWHCSCESNRHGLDQQCSLITLVTAKRA